MSIRQIAALPYRTDDFAINSPARILLITSRETKRWIIPKGNIGSGQLPHSAAAQEAEEEAGILGATCPTPLGSYRYRKKKRNGASVWVDVSVFPFAVTEELPTWDEQHQRERRWFSLEDAAEAVDEEDLRNLIRSFGAADFWAATRSTNIIDTVAQKTGVNTMFAWFQRLLPHQGNFFDLFERHAATLVAGADALARLVQGGNGMADHILEIVEREHDADEITREVLNTVRRTFLTPFDRSAISGLIASMDDAIDEMQKTAGAVALYDVTSFDQEMIDMAAIIVDADEIHASGLKKLFQEHGETDTLRFIIWRELYQHMERVVDRFEDVANEIDGLVIDHG